MTIDRVLTIVVFAGAAALIASVVVLGAILGGTLVGNLLDALRALSVR